MNKKLSIRYIIKIPRAFAMLREFLVIVAALPLEA